MLSRNEEILEETQNMLSRNVENLIEAPDHLPGCMLSFQLFPFQETEDYYNEDENEDKKYEQTCCCQLPFLRVLFFVRIFFLFIMILAIQCGQLVLINYLALDMATVEIGVMAKWITEQKYAWDITEEKDAWKYNAGNETVYSFSGKTFKAVMESKGITEVDLWRDSDKFAQTWCQNWKNHLHAIFGMLILMASATNDIYKIMYANQYHFAESMRHHARCCGPWCLFGPLLRLVLGIVILLTQILLNLVVVAVASRQIYTVSADATMGILAAVEAYFVLEIDDLLVPPLNRICCIRGTMR